MLKYSNILLFFVFMGIATFPVYLFPSGTIQISHLLFFIPAVLVLASVFSDMRQVSRFGIFAIWVLFWVFARQTIYSAQSDSFQIIHALYVLFNFMVSYLIIHVIYKYDYKAISTVFYATVASAVLALIFSWASGIAFTTSSIETYRGASTFNNPNQLGYFSVCAAGILTVLWARFNFSTPLYYLSFGICMILSIISLSKAAMVANVFYFAIWINPKIRYTILGYLILIGVVTVAASTDLSQYKFFERLSGIGTEADGVMERGYHLLLDLDWSLIYGEGKGFDQTKMPDNIEFHSTFGSVLLSYGLLGFIPVLYLFWRVFDRIRAAHSLIFASLLLMPIVVYGVTHDGFRATLAWLFVSTCYAAMRIPKRTPASLPKQNPYKARGQIPR